MRRVPFVPTRIQKSIYIYDVSGLDDTATGYAGLEASRGGGEQNGGGVRRKKERGEGRKDGKNMYTLLYSVADILENKHLPRVSSNGGSMERSKRMKTKMAFTMADSRYF